MWNKTDAISGCADLILVFNSVVGCSAEDCSCGTDTENILTSLTVDGVCDSVPLQIMNYSIMLLLLWVLVLIHCSGISVFLRMTERNDLYNFQ